MKRILALALAVALLLCGCTHHVQRSVWAMDTYMDLQLWGKDAGNATAAVEKLLAALESDWSATREDSLISRLNRGDVVALTAEQSAFLERLEQLSRKTDGAFDPKLGSVSRAWGFGGEEHRVPEASQLAAALAEEQWDLGAAVKGYAGAQAVELLKNTHVTYALLNLGGNVQTYGSKPDGSPWQIGIQNPTGGEMLGVLSVRGTMAVVTSGDYQRYFDENGKRYHHILDSKTGYPVDNGLRSVTVICEDGLLADVMSTALFVMGQEAAAEFWRNEGGFEVVFVLADGRIFATQGAALTGCEYEVIAREK